MFFYGSYLTGLNHENSDIDIHVVFDDDDLEHLIRGVKFVDGMKIEYFEKPLSDLYMSVNNDFDKRNIAWLSILGTSQIIFDKTGDLQQLQNYTLDRFQNPLPKMADNTARKYISIIIE